MNRFSTMTAVLIALAGCSKTTTTKVSTTPAPAISEADAGKLADSTAKVWASMDAAKIKAIYAPTVTGFDYGTPGLPKDRAAWDKDLDIFAAAKYDKITQTERTIQVLDANIFVVSGIWAGTSSALPAGNSSFRCTDVYQKDDDAKWPIVNEHCSSVPKA